MTESDDDGLVVENVRRVKRCIVCYRPAPYLCSAKCIELLREMYALTAFPISDVVESQ